MRVQDFVTSLGSEFFRVKRNRALRTSAPLLNLPNAATERKLAFERRILRSLGFRRGPRAMSFLLIAYDLRRPDYDYRLFFSAMIAAGARRLQASLWGVNTTESAVNICERPWKRLDTEKDRLLVAAVDISQPYRSANDISYMPPVFWREDWSPK
jgi:hypothetical protein